MNIISIDPGYAKKGEGCAVATIHAVRGLQFVRFERPEKWDRAQSYAQHHNVTPDVIIWERPQHRARDDKYANVPPETLIGLAVAGATLAGLYAGAYGAAIVEVHPSEWKGSLPKPVQHKALWARLTDAERATFGDAQVAITRAIIDAIERGARDRWAKDGASYYPSKFTAHNLLDAVGIGKWYLRSSFGIGGM